MATPSSDDLAPSTPDASPAWSGLAAKAIIWLGAFVIHFGLSSLLFMVMYKSGNWFPLLQQWISNGALYITVTSNLIELVVAALTAAYIVRCASKPLLLTALLSLAITASHLWFNLHFLREGLFSPFDFLRTLVVALSLLWLAVWFWFDLVGWGHRR